VTNQAEALYHLQEIDLQIIKLRTRLAETDALLANDEAVAAAQTALKKAQAVLPPLKTRARDLELEVAATLQKATATEEQLYSGRVKNTKEMQDMQQEIAALRKRHGELEESLLEFMVKIDEGETAASEAESGLNAVLDERKDTHRALLDEQADLKRQVERKLADRATALKPVEPASLELYKQLAPKKRNTPVALMRGDSCAGCGVQQNQAVIRQVQLGQSLVTCQNCGRILLYRGLSG
jgi:predicted  nucleic acid-binding Zn-ribbon protein